MAEARVQRKLAAVLAADVVGFSRLMGVDEEATLRTLRDHREIFDGLIARHQGRLFGSAGDSVIAEFASPVEAVRCATEIQLELEQRNGGLPSDRRMRFRIGVNLGDVMVDGDNLLGDGVNVAARLEGLARPGGVCISDTVVSHVRDRLGLEFEDLGVHEVKNIAHPVRVFRVPLASEFLERSPFRGLDVFEYEHADLFHGRANAIATTKDRLQQQAASGSAFLLIYGMSGSGKSSLARAGLLPAITKPGAVADVDAWRFCVFRPSEGDNPFAALVDAIFGESALPELASASVNVGDVKRHFQGRPEAAVAAVEAAMKLAASGEGKGTLKLVVVVDQLEELFTVEEFGTEQREAFITLLGALARSGHVWVIATIRTDFLHRCAGVPGLSALKDGLGSYELLPPTAPEIAQIIRNPARIAGLRFEENAEEGRLEDVLQAAAVRDPASLPLLEFLLNALYEANHERRLLTFADYRRLGGLEGAIARQADEVVASLTDDMQAMLPAVLRSLVTIRLRDEAVTARPVLKSEGAGTSARAALVDALIGARLLVGDDGGGSEAVIRVAHEALLTHWPRARQIIAADREFLETRARVQADTRRWLAEGRNSDLLLPNGKRLVEAEDLLLTRRDEVEDDVAEYVEASSAAQRAQELAEQSAERERLEFEAAASHRLARRTRIAAALALLLAMAAGVGAIVGFRGQKAATQQADLALQSQDEALRTQSLFLADLSRRQTAAGHTTTGILLALEALPANMTESDRPFVTEAAVSLYQALLSRREVAVLQHDHRVNHAAFSPDGGRVATASDDHTARLWDTATGVEVAVLAAHDGGVLHVAFSRDGDRVVTASQDKTARLWDAAEGIEIAALRGHAAFVEFAAFSPDGRRVATCSADRTARLWDAESGVQVAILRHVGNVVHAAFSPDGRRLVTASLDSTAALWDVNSGAKIADLRGHEDNVLQAEFSPDGSRIATVSRDNTVRLWDADTGGEIGIFGGHEEILPRRAWGPMSVHLSFSLDGTRVLTAMGDHTARLWDAADGAELAVFRGHFDRVRRAGLSPDGSRVVTASRDGSARLWDAASAREIAVLGGHDEEVVHAVFSPDGSHVVTASFDGSARVWNATGSSGMTVLRGHERQIGHAAFSHDGSRVATASSDGSARLWETATGQEVAVLQGHEGGISHVALSADGDRVVTASEDRTARVWDAAGGTELAVLGGHEKAVRHAAFSPDGDRLVTSSNDGTARVWDVAGGTEVAVLVGHEDAVPVAAFSPDGMLIVTASNDQTARLWDATSGAELVVLRGHEDKVLHAEFHVDGDRVLTASADQTSRVWSVPSGTEILTLRAQGGAIQQATFSPDGNSVLTTSKDRTARLWDARSGVEIIALRGHLAEVTHAAFSPDGGRVATASRDGSARLWDTTTGAEITTLPGHERSVLHIAYSPDGRHIVTASSDKTARIFDAFPTTQDLIDHARSVVPRDLTSCERKQFFLPSEVEVGNCPN